MGGPLLKKRLSTSFFANRSNIDGSTPTIIKTLDENLTEAETRPNVPSKTVSTYAGGRLDYLINKNNNINLNYNFPTTETTNSELGGNFRGGFAFASGGGGGGGGGGGFGGGGGNSSGNYTKAERASNRENSSHNLRLTETWIINSRMIHEARFQFQRERSDQVAKTLGLAINVADSFSGGGSPCCPNLTDSDSVEYQDYLTTTLKKHTVKGGIQFEFEKFHDLSGGNFNGTYSFSSLDQYRAALRAFGDPSLTQCDPNRQFAEDDPDRNDPTKNPCATQFTINRGNT